MQRLVADFSIAALLYTDSDAAACLLRRLSRTLIAAGVHCAGFVEIGEPRRPGRPRCDMVIENLATGERLTISEDRGPLARGCRLDANTLATAIVQGRNSLQARPDILIVNKFGKTEGEGGGFRPLIADALEIGIPVLIAIPWRNIESWRLFAGDIAREFDIAKVLKANDQSIVSHFAIHLNGASGGTGGVEPSPLGSRN